MDRINGILKQFLSLKACCKKHLFSIEDFFIFWISWFKWVIIIIVTVYWLIIVQIPIAIQDYSEPSIQIVE